MVDHTDVLVLGAGMAGLVAAIELLDAGLQVTVLDLSGDGGMTRSSIGSFTAAQTPWQARAGVVDEPGDHAHLLRGMVERQLGQPLTASERDHIGQLCAAGGQTLTWLAGRGVPLRGVAAEEPHERPRMHNVVGGGVKLVSSLVTALLDRSPVGIVRARAEKIQPAAGGLVVRADDRAWRAHAVVIAVGDQSGALSIPAIHPGDRGALLRSVAKEFGAVLQPPRLRAQLRTVRSPFVAPGPWIVEHGTLMAPNLSSQPLLGVDSAALTELHERHPGIDLYVSMPAPSETQPLATYPTQGWATADDLVKSGLANRQGPTLVLGPLRVVQTTADGALEVDHEMRVRSGNGHVEGLFAVGGSGLGRLRLVGHGHHLLWAGHSALTAARSISTR